MPATIDTSANQEVCRCAIADRGWLIFGTNTDGTGWFIIRATAGKTVDINSVKLELGRGSTLAYDGRPDYSTELAKCQRFLYILTNVGNWQMPVCWGWSMTGEARFAIRNPSAFASKPAVVTTGSATFKLYSNATEVPITEFLVSDLSNDRQTALLRIQGSSGFTQYAPAILKVTGTSGAVSGLGFTCEI